TRRGYRFLQKLLALKPDAELIVFSFREEPWEPPFMDDIRELAESRGHRFYEARNVGSRRWQVFWEATPVDLMLVVSWRYRVPPAVFRRPRKGTFVWHDALLPAYRGFSPTVWAILNGEDQTGATLFEMAEEIDSGDIVDQERVPIGPDDPIRVVMERVTEAYLVLLERNLAKLLAGTAPRHPQDPAQATYTCKRLPQDNRIDWSASTKQIYNLIRAVSAPYPGAFTYLDGHKMIVWAARRLEHAPRYVGRVPGRVVEVRPGEGSVVLTGDGALLLTEVQLEGMPPMCASEVLISLSQTLR
ncbi:MAG: methionyl-tRNA formyltransferase, partial [Chloroflexia bacterium]